jgi:hypothetical protein
MIGSTELNLEAFSLNEESNQKASRFKDCFASTDSLRALKNASSNEKHSGEAAMARITTTRLIPTGCLAASLASLRSSLREP